MKLNILTVTLGRELYLSRLITSITKDLSKNKNIEHHVIFNGCIPSTNIIEIINNANYPIIIHSFQTLVGQGPAQNMIKDKFNEGLVIKLDDDALIQSDRYFDHIQAIHALVPTAVFSPFPVGLIDNLGGVRSNERIVLFSNEENMYYTLRKVPHIGGFARVSPLEYYKRFTFPNLISGEDVHFSSAFALRIPFYYLENALVVEHQESTLGQRKRIENAKGINSASNV